MKNLLILIPFLIYSCNKKDAVSQNTLNPDSVIVSDQNVIENKMDSAANGFVSIDENNALKKSFEKDRILEDTKIIRTISQDQLPIEIADEFTKADQQMIIKIKNFTRRKISGIITPADSKMNIRFNKIKLPNGDYDGPFGRDINYDIPEKGEVWLIIAKSNMASGDAAGKFTVSVK